jgi:hypothetical protein
MMCPNEPVEVEEPLTNVTVPSLNSVILEAKLELVEVNAPLISVLI